MTKYHDIFVFLVIPAALLASGCMHGAAKPQIQPEQVRVEGELSQGQFGCLQVRTAEGQRYNLTRDLEGSKPGQRVWVEGYVVKTKGCMPGPSLMPQHAGLVGASLAETTVPAGNGRR